MSIFIVVYPSGGFHSTTLDAVEAQQRALEIGGLYGELGNVHNPKRPSQSIKLLDVEEEL